MPQSPLNSREKAFCRHYVVLKQGAAAAIQAGYSDKGAKQTASRLLRRREIHAEIGRRRHLVERKASRTPDETVGAPIKEPQISTKENRKEPEVNEKTVTRAWVNGGLVESLERALGRRGYPVESSHIAHKDPLTGELTIKTVTSKVYRVDLGTAVRVAGILHKELDRQSNQTPPKSADSEEQESEARVEDLARAMVRMKERDERRMMDTEAERKRGKVRGSVGGLTPLEVARQLIMMQ